MSRSGPRGKLRGVSDKLESVVRATSHAAVLIADRTAAVDLRAVLAGALLYLVAKAVRARAWFTILRAAFPDAAALRAADVTRAYLAGSGLNTVVPARGGDVVKLAMVHRRIEGSRYPTLAATLVPETLFETACGGGLVVWAFAKGFLPVPRASGELPDLDVSMVVAHPVVSALGTAGAGALAWWLARRLRAPLSDGTAILRSPVRFVTGVASWQALARLIHLGSMAACMAAFRLPVTPSTVVLVMAAQGAGRILPLAPASAGLRLAMLSYGFVEVTGHPVDIAAITAFTFGAGAVLSMAGVAVAVAILALECGTRSPRRALATMRAWERGAPRAKRRSPKDAGVPDGVAAGLGPHAHAVGSRPDADAPQQPTGPRRDGVDDSVVATAEPQHPPVGRHAAHVRRAAARNAPLRDRTASAEGQHGDRALVAVGHVEHAGVAARVQAVRSATRRLQAHLARRARVDQPHAVAGHVGDVERAPVG
jgi:hypothetical protein